MSEQRLPNYSNYLDSLNTYAEALSIKVTYKDGDFDGGEYYHHTRSMTLEPDMPEAVEIPVFLHELGHAMDEVSNPYTKALGLAYAAVYRDKGTQIQKALVLDCEKRAWFYARVIAKLLKIPLGKWFYKHKAYCLRSYR